MLYPSSELDDSSLVDSALTVTLSLVAPNCNTRSAVTTVATDTLTGSTTAVLNPDIPAVTLYAAGGRYGIRYTPAAVLVPRNSTPVATSRATTSTLGIAAPLGSEINPVIVPRSPCASRVPITARNRTAALK